VRRNASGKRLDRQDYCPYCGQQFSRLQGHVFNEHQDQAAVKRLITAENNEDKTTQKKIVAR
jgi:hypothetical protein